MNNLRRILFIVGSTAIVLVALWALLSLTPREQLETQLYGLSVNKTFYYYGEEYFYIVLDLTAQYSGGGKWTIWRTSLKLVTDLGSVLEPDPMPPELKKLCGFKNEIASSVNVTSYKPVRFQVAYIASPREKPVKLVYEGSGERIEATLAGVPSANLSSIIHYSSVNVKVEVPTLVPDTSAQLSSDLEWKCYAPGSDLEISIRVHNTGRLSRLRGVYTELEIPWKIPIIVSKIDAIGATVVGAEPEPPTILYADSAATIRIRLRTPTYTVPQPLHYYGPLVVVLTVEPAEQTRALPLELIIDGVYDFRSYSISWSPPLPPLMFTHEFMVFNLSVKLNTGGMWIVRRDAFRLITDKGRELEPIRIPSELAMWCECGFDRELTTDIEVFDAEYKQFQIAFAVKHEEEPVKLVYSIFDVKIEVPVVAGGRIYPVCYHYVKAGKDTTMPFPYFNVNVQALASDIARKCYLTPSEFNVSVSVRYSRTLIGQDLPINITKISIIGAILVDTQPKLPVTLNVEEEVTIRIRLRTPEGSSYLGPLNIVLTIEPKQ